MIPATTVFMHPAMAVNRVLAQDLYLMAVYSACRDWRWGRVSGQDVGSRLSRNSGLLIVITDGGCKNAQGLLHRRHGMAGLATPRQAGNYGWYECRYCDDDTTWQ